MLTSKPPKYETGRTGVLPIAGLAINQHPNVQRSKARALFFLKTVLNLSDDKARRLLNMRLAKSSEIL
jgi:hypothetical protein